MDVIEAQKPKQESGGLLDLFLLISVIFLIGLGVCLYYEVGIGTKQDENQDPKITTKTVDIVPRDIYRTRMMEAGSKQDQQYNNILKELEQTTKDLAETNQIIEQEFKTMEINADSSSENLKWVLEKLHLSPPSNKTLHPFSNQKLLDETAKRDVLQDKQQRLQRQLKDFFLVKSE